MPSRQVLTLATVLVLVALCSCAKVQVRKVPTPTQYNVWTDEMQRRSDSMAGLRFYLPRPFVNVFDSFPVRTDIFFADGYVSSDGKYVTITGIRGSHGSFTSLASDSPAAGTVNVPARAIGNTRGVSTEGGDVANGSRDGSAKDTAPASGDTAASNQSASGSAPSTIQTGKYSQAATNDNSAFAYQPLRGSMDVVYLPDFEEQYVVTGSSGLGNAQFNINLGQGWSLQGFNAQSDNSALNQRIFQLIDTAQQFASQAATAASGHLTQVLGKANAISPNGGGVLDATQAAALPASGERVTLKLVVVHYVAKGMYPVIKPRELQERSGPNVRDVIDIANGHSTVYFPGDAIPRARANANAASTIPIYPYQYISFNTFSYVAIQLLRPEDAPFGALYSATGVEGTGGGRTDDELLRTLKGQSQPPTTPDQPTTTSPLMSDLHVKQSLTGNFTTGQPSTVANGVWTVALNPPTQLPTQQITMVTLNSKALDAAKGVDPSVVSVTFSGLPSANLSDVDAALSKIMGKKFGNSTCNGAFLKGAGSNITATLLLSDATYADTIAAKESLNQLQEVQKLGTVATVYIQHQ